MIKFFILVLVATLVLARPPASAETFEDGLRFYRAGDYDSARTVWLLLAVAGARDAQYRYGGVYRDGKGVSQDNAVAVEWFLKAGRQGQVNAQNALGFMFDYGDGLPQDQSDQLKKQRAISWSPIDRLPSLKNVVLLPVKQSA